MDIFDINHSFYCELLSSMFCREARTLKIMCILDILL